MKLLSGWTLTLKLSQVQNSPLSYLNTEISISLFCFYHSENGEWAIVHRPARKVINTRYSPDDLEYQEIMFNLVIQRKPLFYIINVILPCSLISSLVVLAYFLPAQGLKVIPFNQILYRDKVTRWFYWAMHHWREMVPLETRKCYTEERFDRGGRDEGCSISCSVHHWISEKRLESHLSWLVLHTCNIIRSIYYK